MAENLVGIVGLAAALLLDLLVSAARASLLNTSMARLLAQNARVEPQLKRTLDLLRIPARLQVTFNLVQNLLRFMMVGLLLFLFSSKPETLNPGNVALGLLLLAVLITWLEWGARSLALSHAEEWALRAAPFAWALMFLLGPLVALAMAVSGEDASTTTSGSEVVDELKTLVDAGQQGGALEVGERKMIFSIFELGDTLAREIMVPRIDISALDVQTPLADAVDYLLESGYTRIPIYEETIDNILGLLYSKDLLRVWRQGNQLTSLRDLARPAHFVPEAKKADELMAEMQAQRIHMAIIVDEYGGVAGLVTLEDIVEEILGEIQDEYDQGEELPYVALADGEYLFQGRVDLDDFNEILGSKLPKEEADTLGGFIYSQLGRVPTTGDDVRVDDLLLIAEQVIGRRIRKVRARRIPASIASKEPIADVDE